MVFIPLIELKLPNKIDQKPSLGDPLSDHEYIKRKGIHNFLGHQLETQSQLDPDAWDKYLKGYWDNQLPLLL